jgi:hypothetical protein
MNIISVATFFFILTSNIFWASTADIEKDSKQACLFNSTASDGTIKSIDRDIPKLPLEKCGPESQLSSELSELGELIFTAMHMISVESSPLCVVEVGTGFGSGTTVALMDTLYQQCLLTYGRDFHLYTYEGDSQIAKQAADLWAHHPKVTVINENVMDEDLLEPYVLAHIQGPDSDTFPGKSFYERVYATMHHSGGSGFLRTRPPCAADLVLIDSTRFAHAGIVATLLRAPPPSPADPEPPEEPDPPAAGGGGVRARTAGGAFAPVPPGARARAAMAARGRTVFVVEDDWAPPTGDGERAVLERHWRLEDLVEARPDGQEWPWFVFRVAESDSESDGAGLPD